MKKTAHLSHMCIVPMTLTFASYTYCLGSSRCLWKW